MKKQCEECKLLLPLYANNDFTESSFKCHWCEQRVPNNSENRIIHAQYCIYRDDLAICECESKKIQAFIYLKECIKRVSGELELAKTELLIITNGFPGEIFQWSCYYLYYVASHTLLFEDYTNTASAQDCRAIIHRDTWRYSTHSEIHILNVTMTSFCETCENALPFYYRNMSTSSYTFLCNWCAKKYSQTPEIRLAHMKLCPQRPVKYKICGCYVKADEILKEYHNKVRKMQMDSYAMEMEVRAIKAGEVSALKDIIHYCFDHFTRHYWWLRTPPVLLRRGI